MTLKELIAQFRSDTEDVAEPYLWSKADLVRWFNEAEEEACIRAKLIFDKTSSFTEIFVTAAASVYDVDQLITEIEYARLVNAAGDSFPITSSDRVEQDRMLASWRTTVGLPSAFIHDETQLELNRLLDADYTLFLEAYRKPLETMASDSDEPEIASRHHRMLVEWVKHRAYEKPDAEVFNPKKSAESLERFEAYFGPRPDASIRRRQQANRPHHNKACW